MSEETPETKDELQPPTKPEAVVVPPPDPSQCEAIAKTISGTGSDVEETIAKAWATEYNNAIGETVGGLPVAEPKAEGEGGS